MKSIQIWRFFWSVFSLNEEKYGPEKLRIRTLFTHCMSFSYSRFYTETALQLERLMKDLRILSPTDFTKKIDCCSEIVKIESKIRTQ